MIARVEGVVREVAPTRAVIDVGGVGYELHIPLSTFSELPDVGKTTALHVHTHARDGAIQLFGFATTSERAAFQLLLRASRVGPRLAQTIVSGISPAELLDAIRNGRVAVLRAAPGVGTKLAERILVELRDRAPELEAALRTEDPGVVVGGLDESGALADQTLSALLNLGYSKSQAERARARALAEVGEDATLETVLRTALRALL